MEYSVDEIKPNLLRIGVPLPAWDEIAVFSWKAGVNRFLPELKREVLGRCRLCGSCGCEKLCRSAEQAAYVFSVIRFQQGAGLN